LIEFAPPRQLNRYMASDEQRRARTIQESIHDILLRDWDPIGINDVSEAQDEYDSYIGGVYRLVASHYSIDQLVDYLATIESQTMGLDVPNRERLTRVANQLLALDLSL
jgi:hypothetical protein